MDAWISLNNTAEQFTESVRNSRYIHKNATVLQTLLLKQQNIQSSDAWVSFAIM